MSVDVAHVRPARPKDANALANTYEEAWRGAYQGIIPHLHLERMIARHGPRWWDQVLQRRASVLVLDFGGEVAGYVTFGRSRIGRGPFAGEIFELYLHPTYQGLGLGSKLFNGARQKLREMRLNGLLVWALADNETACDFYLRLGGKPIAEGLERFDETGLRKIAFAWR
ncbi:MAG: GNAT family N-acetyltransferase [Methyloceanibacter sp.]|uniref:GNAT family N-acetyltransferase n=1 Tax=Methyloceanibacter sp. TaxID=1965321 RepID=UPI001D77A5F5|nr:GNAT family N-acetyltransferase [Methyloceanibacter sp.]MCB1443313.1 GNAT family N-acetyltransferase [Methyloceanibacter sp.]MCC0059190.1 GNAT family N-acetyltransferase [Hyphomicrobiaceae bacterium]